MSHDLHGHSVGAGAWRAIATCLRRTLRTPDVTIRYGGDEFLLPLPGETTEGAQRVLSEIRDSIAAIALRTNEGRLVPLSVGGGIAMFPEDGKNLRDLLMSADKGLLASKRAVFD